MHIYALPLVVPPPALRVKPGGGGLKRLSPNNPCASPGHAWPSPAQRTVPRLHSSLAPSPLLPAEANSPEATVPSIGKLWKACGNADLLFFLSRFELTGKVKKDQRSIYIRFRKDQLLNRSTRETVGALRNFEEG